MPDYKILTKKILIYSYVLVYLLSVASVSAAKNWTTFSMDNTHTCVNNEDEVYLADEPVWTRSMPSTDKQAVYTDKYIILPTENSIFIYTIFNGAKVITIDLSDIRNPNDPNPKILAPSVSVHDNSIYFNTAGSAIYKFDLETGTVKSSYFGGTQNLKSVPAIIGDVSAKVYLGFKNGRLIYDEELSSGKSYYTFFKDTYTSNEASVIGTDGNYWTLNAINKNYSAMFSHDVEFGTIFDPADGRYTTGLNNKPWGRKDFTTSDYLDCQLQNLVYYVFGQQYPTYPVIYNSNSYYISYFWFLQSEYAGVPALIKLSLVDGIFAGKTELPGDLMSHQMLCVDDEKIFLPIRGISPDSTGIYCYGVNGGLKWFKKANLPAQVNIVKIDKFLIEESDEFVEALLVCMGTDSDNGEVGLCAIDPENGNILWKSVNKIENYSGKSVFVQSSGSSVYVLDGENIYKHGWLDDNGEEGKKGYGYSVNGSRYISESGADTGGGNFIKSVSDAEIPGKGLSFRFVRTYNSKSEYVGMLGKGWSSNYELNLTQGVSSDDEDTIDLFRGDGAIIEYTKTSPGMYEAPSWEKSYIAQDGNEYRLVERSGLEYTFYGFAVEGESDFNKNGKLKQIKDRNNNTMIFTYNISGYLASIFDSSGRTITLDVSNGLLRSITLPDTDVITYSYSGEQMVSVIGPGDTTGTYTYSNGMISSYSEPRLPGGDKRKSVLYDNKRRVTQIFANSDLGALKMIEEYEYDTILHKTRKYDAKRNYYDFYYNDKGQVIRTVKPDNSEIKYEWSGFNKGRITDEEGIESKYYYNEFGEVVSSVNGENESESYSYDSYGNLLTSVNGRGDGVTCSYNAATGNLETKTNNLDITFETNTYYSGGLLKDTTDGEGNKTEYTYDSYGYPDKIKDPTYAITGFEEDYDYDNVGRVLFYRDKNGVSVAYSYYPNGMLQTETKGSYTKTFTYDSLLRIQSISAPDMDAMYEYDDFDRVHRITDKMGYYVEYEYDDNGNLTSTKDQNGKVTTFVYDNLNRQTGINRADSGVIQKSYKKNGWIDTLTKPEGGTVEYKYDNAGRVTELKFQQKTVKKYYDDAGNLIKLSEGQLFNEVVTEYEYDSAERLVKIKMPSNKEMEYEYYLNGQVKKVTRNWDHWTEDEVNYTYYKNGRLQTAASSDETRTYTYDGNGNKKSYRIQRGSIDETISYDYDSFDRLTTITDPDSEQFVYAYDAIGRKESLTYPNETKINYNDYDDLNRVGNIEYTRQHIPEQPVMLDRQAFLYDHGINITKETSPYEVKNYTYDNVYRMISVTRINASETDTYNYDKNGRRTSINMNEVVTNYSYKANGDERFASAGSDSYSYDSRGNVSRINNTSYIHDDMNMLVAVKGEGKDVEFKYDIEKRLKFRDDNNADERMLYLYDGRDMIGEVQVMPNLTEKLTSLYIRGLNGELLKEKKYTREDNSANDFSTNYYYYPDRMGGVKFLCDSAGMIIEKETTDEYGDGKVKGISKHGLSSNMYDSATGLYYFAARWYDANTGRFLEMDPVLNELTLINMYDYCNNNPVNITDRYGENFWDWLGDKISDAAEEKAKKKYSGGKDKTISMSNINDENDLKKETKNLPKTDYYDYLKKKDDENLKSSIKDFEKAFSNELTGGAIGVFAMGAKAHTTLQTTVQLIPFKTVLQVAAKGAWIVGCATVGYSIGYSYTESNNKYIERRDNYIRRYYEEK